MNQRKNYTHGGEVYDKEVTLDYSINVNPFGMPDSVKEAIISQIDNYVKYPDDSCIRLREAISNQNKKANITKEMVLCGNGAADLIYRLCLAVKPARAMVLAPTFSEYEQALQMVDCEVIHYQLKEENGFQVEEDLLQELEHKQCEMVFLCNPNNPIGNLISPNRMSQILKGCKERDILVAVDECFMEFTKWEATNSVVPDLAEYKNLIVIKAFTKTYAMAGLRLGYVLCADTELLGRMKECGPPWAVSSVAQAAGIAALSETEYVDKARTYIEKERAFLAQGLKELGCKVYESTTNYLVFQDASYRKETKSLYERMLERKILIRQCGNYYGLGESYYRITVGLHKDNLILMEALKEEING